jgi:linoleoyl-CoA desaturase
MNSKIAYSHNKDSDFHYKQLKRLVNDRLKALPAARKEYPKILALILPLTYLGLYIVALFNVDSIPTFYFLYSLMGIVMVLTFLSAIHETVHGNLFHNSGMNRLIMLFFDLAGANSYIWKKRHLIMHHNFPNIAGWDTDIQQAGIIKIYPQEPVKGLQRYQHYYFIFLYPFYLINWVFVRDFKDFFSEKQLIKKAVHIPKEEYLKLFVFKIIYFLYILVIPILLGLPVIHAFMALFTMLIISGIFALTSLLTPHANIKSQFPVPEDQHLIQSGWFFHQLSTTNDISINNWFTRNLMGNFNFHLAHHLFPHISCVYAPEVTEVIRDYTRENHLSYRSYPFFTALKFHYLLLKQNAQRVVIFEEDL